MVKEDLRNNRTEFEGEINYDKKYNSGNPLFNVSKKHRCNKIAWTVPVNALYEYHNPTTWVEAEILIAEHQRGGKYEHCECGCKAKGNIYDFAARLYKGAQKDGVQTTFQDCVNWMVALFIQNSIEGQMMEEMCCLRLQVKLGTEYEFESTSIDVDRQAAVDFHVKYNGKHICGLQVKPISFQKMPEKIRQSEFARNKRYNKPVVYIHYDNNIENVRDRLVDIDEVAMEILKLCNKELTRKPPLNQMILFRCMADNEGRIIMECV